jgi:chromodomain-helicase-DNA-binding protein 1
MNSILARFHQIFIQMYFSRLEAIAQDAELEDHSTGELAQLGEELLRGCDEAAKEYERNGSTQLERRVGDDGKRKQDRGPVFRLGGVDVYVRPLRKVQADLEPLSMLVPKERQLISTFRIPGRPRPQKGWDVSWEDEDDSALLRGIHLYGMGSWDAIKMDPDLGLVDKVSDGAGLVA